MVQYIGDAGTGRSNSSGLAGEGFRAVTPRGMGAVAWFVTEIPVARDGRDKGRKAVSGE